MTENNYNSLIVVTVGRSNSNGDISRQRFSCDSYVVALTNGSCTQAMAMCDNNQIQTIACHNSKILDASSHYLSNSKLVVL